MKPVYVYPGSFDPPTFGHFHVVKKAVALFGNLIIVCSVNDNKSGQWFSADEAKQLWQTYDLPENVQVMTLSEVSNLVSDFSKLVMIRGIRDQADLEENTGVLMLNHQQFGINNFVYLFADQDFKEVSSTRAREALQQLDYWTLKQCVNQIIVKSMEARLVKKFGYSVDDLIREQAEWVEAHYG